MFIKIFIRLLNIRCFNSIANKTPSLICVVVRMERVGATGEGKNCGGRKVANILIISGGRKVANILIIIFNNINL